MCVGCWHRMAWRALRNRISSTAMAAACIFDPPVHGVAALAHAAGLRWLLGRRVWGFHKLLFGGARGAVFCVECGLGGFTPDPRFRVLKTDR